MPKNYLYKRYRAEAGLPPGVTYAETDPESLKKRGCCEAEEKPQEAAADEGSKVNERTNAD